jgi:acetylornithine/succinyldiaminopimelate/putrescine aminotransferase
VRALGALGVDLVIGRREGYRLWDLEGRALLDFHLNGGVSNRRGPSRRGVTASICTAA